MTLLRSLQIFVLLAGVISCSTTKVKQDTVSGTAKVDEAASTAQTEQPDYLQLARQIYAETGSAEQRNSWLLKAADQLLQQQHYRQSLKLLRLLKPQLNTTAHRQQLQLLAAENLFAVGGEQATAQAIQIVSSLPVVAGYSGRYFQLKARLFSQQQQWLNASLAILNSDLDEEQQSQLIWQYLQHLELRQLQLALRNQPTLAPWLQLSVVLRKQGLNPLLFKQQVADWQQTHNGHVLARNLPQEIHSSLQQQAIQPAKIAVLLPLSGRLASQGQALKEGILAAYWQKLAAQQLASFTSETAVEATTYQQLQFFDSNLKSPEQLAEMVVDYDFVLGPLLKENINGLREVLSSDKIMLALNRSDDDGPQLVALDELQSGADKPADKEHYFFALAPEDEAEQLAHYIKQQGYKRPIVFSADNSVTARMTDAFVDTWVADRHSARAPDIAVFSDSKDMREQVESLLDVAQSKERISQMENTADIEVYAETRNRQDIDVIVLFANPEQTELLNPIIEASLSPSAEHSLAIFASSRSYSQELTKNSLRDLRNLTFSDMPWMLPGHPWSQLASQTAELWPQRQDSLMRLFAMGYDAYELISSLRQLKALPQLSKAGLTGQLSVTDNGVLHRRLPLAKVLQDRISLVKLD